ncbi:MAG TPA: FGGY family carbohydrate kinase [Terriglobia bacterium]|nr:FGGY family carbohydrate kinase [Terriglobia bacterium]
MTVLCFDISSGGIAAALFSAKLEVTKVTEQNWKLELDDSGAATLSLNTVVERFRQVIRELAIAEPIDAVCIGTFMHNIVLLDDAGKPLTPVFTWLDRRGEKGLEYLRSRLGERFFERTGCRFHPMFPIFKLATLYLDDPSLIARARRIVSLKTFLTHRLTGAWAEDHGMASASGLYNIGHGDWDPGLLGMLELKRENVPDISDRTAVTGRLSRDSANDFGLPGDIPVINGSGDGVFAHLGSDCETADKISVTLGTSAVARQALSSPLLDSSSGTFCYRADENSYLLGCAGNNGGNVLDWGRSIFGDLDSEASTDVPILIPLLHGERSPEWDPHLTGSWHGLKARHTPADLARSVLEGVVFNLGYFVEILQRTSEQTASEIVLSGNGFLDRLAAPILAAVAGVPVSMPSRPGAASLRGAAACALRALGLPVPPLPVKRVVPLDDPRILDRYNQYKELRLADR